MNNSHYFQLADRRLAEVVPDAIIVFDTHNKILWWNAKAQKLFGLDPAKHTQLDQVFGNEFCQNNLFATTKKTIEIALPKQPGEHIAISIMPYVDDYYLLLAQNVTHIHQLEIVRQDFVANVSHELRTPLTVIHGYLETLLHQDLENPQVYKKIFEQMYQQSSRMERLVEDLLLLARLETELPVHEKQRKINVAAMLQTICHEAQALSGERQHIISCTVDKNVEIYGLEDELRSIFSNIIFNAVNYTPAQGEIAVSWYQEGNRAVFKTKDTGIGIAPEDIPRITERFYRVDKARSRASGGTGLGLAIVKHALLRHKAQLKIESDLGKGSTFFCIFPFET